MADRLTNSVSLLLLLIVLSLTFHLHICIKFDKHPLFFIICSYKRGVADGPKGCRLQTMGSEGFQMAGRDCSTFVKQIRQRVLWDRGVFAA